MRDGRRFRGSANARNSTIQALCAGPSMSLLRGSLVITGVISGVAIIITHINGFMTPLIATHEPPRRVLG